MSDGSDVSLLMAVDRNPIRVFLASAVIPFRDEAGPRHTGVAVRKQVACVMWLVGHARRPTRV